MADSTYNLGINVSVGSVGVNSTLNAIEQRFQKFSKSVQASSQSMNASMKGSLSTIDQEMNKFDQLNNKMQKVSTGKESVASKSQKMEQTTKKENKALNDLDKTTQNHTKAIKGNNTATENWLSSHTRSIGIALRSTVVWGLATTAIYGSQRALREAHQTMMEVNSEMVALQRVMNEAITDFDMLRNTASDLGVNYAANIQDVISSMVEWGRQGRNQVEVIELTEAALLATNVAEMEAKESVDLLTASLLQFNMDASEAKGIIDRWNEVANNFAVTATDLAIAVRESGSAAQSAGVSMDELIGMTTALSAATAKSGSRIGRSLRTTFSRIMGDAGATEESLGKVEVALNSVGIALRRDEDSYRNLTDVLTDLSLKWDELDEVMQANIARAIGGRRRYSDVIALIENWDMALDATSSSMDSLNSAIEENETYMQGMEANWKQVRAEFNQIINTFTNFGSDVLSITVANALSGILSDLNDFIVGIKETEIMLKTLSTAILGAGGAYIAITKFNAGLAATEWLLGFRSGISILNSGFVSLVSAINPAVVAIGALTYGITNYIAKQGELASMMKEARNDRETLNKIIERSNELTSTEIKNSTELVEKYEGLVETYNDLEESINDINGGSSTSSIVGMNVGSLGKQIELVNRLREVFVDLSEEYSNNEKFIEAVDEELEILNTTLENSVSSISDSTTSLIENTRQEIRQAKALEDKIETYRDLENVNDKNIEQQYEMEQLQRDLLQQYPQLATGAGSFSENLAKLGENTIPKFTANSSHLNSVIETLETRLKTLQTANNSLNNQYDLVTKKLGEAEEQYRNLSEEQLRNDDLVRDLTELISKYTERQDKLESQIKKGQETQVLMNQAIEDFKNGMEGTDFTDFLSNVAGAVDILNEFNEEANNILVRLEDIRSEVSDELDFQNWLGGLLGRTDVEQLESEIGVIEGYFTEVQNMAQELFTMDPGSFQTTGELRDYIEENLSIATEDIEGFNIDDIFEMWDEQEFENVQQAGKDLAERLILQFNESLEDMEDRLELGNIVEEVISTADLSSLNMEELQNIVDIYYDLLNQEDQNMIMSIFGGSEELSTLLKIGAEAERILELREEEIEQRKRLAVEYEKMNKAYERQAEIEESLQEIRLESMTEYEQDLADVNSKLEKLNTWEEETHSLDTKDRIAQIRVELEKEKEVLEAITNLEDTGAFGIISSFEDFNISEITSMDEASNKMEELESNLKSFRDRLRDLGLEEDQIQDTLKMLGLDEETIDAVFEELDGKILDLRQTWYQSMAEGITNAIEQFTDDMSIGNKFSILLREGLSSAFADLPEDELRSKFEGIGDWLGESLNLGETFGESFGDFAMSAGQVFAQGGSIGQSLVSGIGSVVSGSSVIGGVVGSIGQAIFGGVEGRDEMEAAKKINQQIESAQRELEDFGIFFDAQLASYEDNAGFFQGLFGGEDWDVSGIEKAERSLEDMEEILGRVENTANQLSSGIMDLFSQNLSYGGFKRQFDQTIGQALQDAVLEKIWETQVIEQYTKRLAGLMENVINEDMTINYEALARYREEAEIVGEELETRYKIWRQISGELDGGNLAPDITTDRTFRAGSTSNITYNNTFTVQSQIFLGDKASAREAAKKLAPYIKDHLDSRA